MVVCILRLYSLVRVGRSQAVRQRVLASSFGGSNPSAPENYFYIIYNVLLHTAGLEPATSFRIEIMSPVLSTTQPCMRILLFIIYFYELCYYNY